LEETLEGATIGTRVANYTRNYAFENAKTIQDSPHERNIHGAWSLLYVVIKKLVTLCWKKLN